jgi:hypothetical protein
MTKSSKRSEHTKDSTTMTNVSNSDLTIEPDSTDSRQVIKSSKKTTIVPSSSTSIDIKSPDKKSDDIQTLGSINAHNKTPVQGKYIESTTEQNQISLLIKQFQTMNDTLQKLSTGFETIINRVDSLDKKLSDIKTIEQPDEQPDLSEINDHLNNPNSSFVQSVEPYVEQEKKKTNVAIKEAWNIITRIILTSNYSALSIANNKGKNIAESIKKIKHYGDEYKPHFDGELNNIANFILDDINNNGNYLSFMERINQKILDIIEKNKSINDDPEFANSIIELYSDISK